LEAQKKERGNKQSCKELNRIKQAAPGSFVGLGLKREGKKKRGRKKDQVGTGSKKKKAQRTGGLSGEVKKKHNIHLFGEQGKKKASKSKKWLGAQRL